MVGLICYTVPDAEPQNVIGYFSSTSSIQLMWHPPPQNRQHGDIVHYTIRVTDLNSLRTVEYFSNQTTLLVAGVSSNVTYAVTVAAVTRKGIGPYSHVIFITIKW